uniref:probable WRKY transcription factor 70 n=1 Tax=Erigeron canadensis TaxID=72917 RepID=UPI001CB94BAD|nr:probable WRKY transcription factor 70 [Erigeron canadensis]
MEFPFGQKVFSTTQPHPSKSSIMQGHELTNKIQDFSRLSKTVLIDPTSTNCISIQPLEMFDNFEFPSIMSDYSVNYSVNQIYVPINRVCSPHNFASERSTTVNKLVKNAKPVKNKRGRYVRKSSWTSTQVTSLIDDGHTWRKYGQKEIIDARHKRNYYRCTHKFDQGCQATKQVQKIEDEPQKYKITYHRHHTCKNFLRTPQIFLDTADHNDTSVLLNFESNELILNDKLVAHFPLHTQEEPTYHFSSLESMENQSSMFDNNNNPPHNLIISDSSRLEPREKIISTGLYSPIYEIDHILEDIDLSEIPFDFTH